VPGGQLALPHTEVEFELDAKGVHLRRAKAARGEAGALTGARQVAMSWLMAFRSRRRRAAALLGVLLLASQAARAAEPASVPEAGAAKARTVKPGPAKPGGPAPKANPKAAGRAAAPIVWEPQAGREGKERPKPALDLGDGEPVEVVRSGRCGG
jgi:hypothetical protein